MAHGVDVVIEIGQAVRAGIWWSVKYSKSVQLGLEGEFQNCQFEIGTRINQWSEWDSGWHIDGNATTVAITVPANDIILGEVKFSIKDISREPGFCDSYEIIAAAGANTLKVVHFWEQTLCIEW